LEKNANDYSKKIVTISFVGYEPDFCERPYYALMFDGQRVNDIVYPADNKVSFLINNDLVVVVLMT
jgi:hypothetical protein